jgi:hypothetical protein
MKYGPIMLITIIMDIKFSMMQCVFQKFILLFLIILFGNSIVSGQDLDYKGGIKTHDGVLLYFNKDKDTYTIDLKGEIDLNRFPIVKVNANFFELKNGPKSMFGKSEDEILINFQIWEHKYLEDELFKQKIIFKQKRLKIKNKVLNFWFYEMPKNQIIDKPVQRTFYLDFIQGQRVYGFSYPSFSGNEREGKDFLIGLFNSMHFYNKSIDINHLRRQIVKGVNYY